MHIKDGRAIFRIDVGFLVFMLLFEPSLTGLRSGRCWYKTGSSSEGRQAVYDGHTADDWHRMPYLA